MMKENDDPTCAVIILLAGLGFLVFLVYKIVLFFQSPDATQRFIESLKGLGLCVGAAVLVLAGLTLYSVIAAKRPPPRLKRLSREYPVRCYPVELEKMQPGQVPANQPEAPGQESVHPVYFQISITNYGLRLAVLPEKYTWDVVPTDNTSRFSRLSSGSPGPVILPNRCMDLRFLFHQQKGSFAFELTPAGQAGYPGVLTAPPAGYDIRIVVVYSAILDEKNLHQTIELEQPMKIKLVALGKDGRDDLAATRKLYLELFKWIQTFAVDDDDSWMYRSRPIYW